MSEIGNKNHLDYRFMDVQLGTANGLVRGQGGSEFDWGFGRKQNPADCEDRDLVTNFVESLPVFRTVFGIKLSRQKSRGSGNSATP